MQPDQFYNLTRAKEPSVPYYLPISGGENRFMPFSSTLSWSKTQIAQFRIWSWVIDSISNDGNHCIKVQTISPSKKIDVITFGKQELFIIMAWIQLSYI